MFHGFTWAGYSTQPHNTTATSKLIKASIKSCGLSASQPVVHTTYESKVHAEALEIGPWFSWSTRCQSKDADRD